MLQSLVVAGRDVLGTSFQLWILLKILALTCKQGELTHSALLGKHDLLQYCCYLVTLSERCGAFLHLVIL